MAGVAKVTEARHSESLEEVRERFRQWRAARGRGEHIPRVLWAAAVGIAREQGLHVAARELHLDYDGLKRRQYGYRPLLLKTFVEQARFRGTGYQAANWICLGQTTGRGKLDVHHQPCCPSKPSGSILSTVTSDRGSAGDHVVPAPISPHARPRFLRSYTFNANHMALAQAAIQNIQLC
jgi:hypothetical protein